MTTPVIKGGALLNPQNLEDADQLDGTEEIPMLQSESVGGDDGATVQRPVKATSASVAGAPIPPSDAESGTDYTFVLEDSGGYKPFTSGSAVTATIPPNSEVPFAIGAVLTWEQSGAGVVTATEGAGVTINARGGLVDTNGQYAVVSAKQVDTDVWTLIGDRA